MPLRRRQANWPLRLAVVALFGGLLAYVFLIPLIEYQLVQRLADGVRHDRTRLVEGLRLRGLEALTGLWFFSVGATIGSFLNVVAYRLPRRLTLVWQPSRCPWCETPIKFRDNIPVFGWLSLRGRCRSCRLPISPRYPIVELVAGLMFLSVYLFEFVSGGANLPIRTPNQHSGVIWAVYSVQWDLIRYYVYHTFLLSTLLTCVLIRLDRVRLPGRLFSFGLLFGMLLPMAWPDVWLVKWMPTKPEWLPAATSRIGTGLVGLTLGIVCAASLFAVTRRGHSKNRPGLAELVMPLGLVGVFLGWQAVISVTLIACVMMALLALMSRSTCELVPWSAGIFLGTWLNLALWRILDEFHLWPGTSATAHIYIFALSLALLLASICVIHRRPPDPWNQWKSPASS